MYLKVTVLSSRYKDKKYSQFQQLKIKSFKVKKDKKYLLHRNLHQRHVRCSLCLSCVG